MEPAGLGGTCAVSEERQHESLSDHHHVTTGLNNPQPLLGPAARPTRPPKDNRRNKKGRKLTLQHHCPHSSHFLPLLPSPGLLSQPASRLYRLNISSRTPASARALRSSSGETSGLGKKSSGRAVYLASVAARRAATSWEPVPEQRGTEGPKRAIERAESIVGLFGEA